MVKKFSYLVSVSVLASSLLSSTSHAIFELDLTETINNFRIQQRVVPVDPSPLPSSSPSSDDETSSWFSSAYSAGSSALLVAGNTCRYLGDTIRGESPVGDLLVSQALSYAGTAVPQSKPLTTDPSIIESSRKVFGNLLRGAGAYMVGGETPTLERELREFWITKRVFGEEVFISTAAALYASGLTGQEIRLNYHNFIESMNRSSRAVPSRDAGKNVEYFLKGIIRGVVMNKAEPSDFESDFDFIASQATALGITHDILPTTQAITEGTARQNAFKEFVKGTYEFESVRRQADHARWLSLRSASSTPSADPVSSSPLAIEDLSSTPSVNSASLHAVVEDLPSDEDQD